MFESIWSPLNFRLGTLADYRTCKFAGGHKQLTFLCRIDRSGRIIRRARPIACARDFFPDFGHAGRYEICVLIRAIGRERSDKTRPLSGRARMNSSSLGAKVPTLFAD
jgi:hypothetical protein